MTGTTTTTVEGRRIIRWMAAVLAAAVLAATPALPAEAGGAHHRPGRPVFVEPLPASLWLPGTAAILRLASTRCR